MVKILLNLKQINGQRIEIKDKLKATTNFGAINPAFLPSAPIPDSENLHVLQG